MSPTERWESGRSTRSSTRRSSSRMATRVSRGFPEISISRFKAVTLAPRRETSASREPVVFPAIVQLARPIWRGHRDDSIGEAAERRQSPMHGGKRKTSDRSGQHNGRTKAVDGGRRRGNATCPKRNGCPGHKRSSMIWSGSVRAFRRLERVPCPGTPSLQGNNTLSEERGVRTDIAGTAGRLLSGGKHCRGFFQKRSGRVSALSRYFPRLSLRGRIRPTICSRVRTAQSRRVEGIE